MTSDELLFSEKPLKRQASHLEFLSPARAITADLIDRHAELSLARTKKIVAIFRTKALDEVRENEHAQG
jgi:hypothetical protein